MKKSPTKLSPLNNRIDFEVTVDRISFAQTELRTVLAARDHAIQEAQADTAARVAELEEEIEEKGKLCMQYAVAHRAELLPDEASSKTNETPHSRYGFRTGMPQLKKLSKLTWEKIAAAIKAARRPLWLRTKVEVAKDVVLASVQANPKKNTKIIEQLGMSVAQEEAFFIEPKVDGGEQIKPA